MTSQKSRKIKFWREDIKDFALKIILNSFLKLFWGLEFFSDFCGEDFGQVEILVRIFFF